MKDEALTPIGLKMETLPIAAVTEVVHEKVQSAVDKMRALISARKSGNQNIIDWLRVEFGVEKASRLLATPERLRGEWIETVAPVSAAHDKIVDLERQLSDLVNAAYGLTPEEVKLMWETAPPRMPLDPTGELQRLD